MSNPLLAKITLNLVTCHFLTKKTCKMYDISSCKFNGVTMFIGGGTKCRQRVPLGERFYINIAGNKMAELLVSGKQTSHE